jgi:hypothetical protein
VLLAVLGIALGGCWRRCPALATGIEIDVAGEAPTAPIVIDLLEDVAPPMPSGSPRWPGRAPMTAWCFTG